VPRLTWYPLNKDVCSCAHNGVPCDAHIKSLGQEVCVDNVHSHNVCQGIQLKNNGVCVGSSKGTVLKDKIDNSHMLKAGIP